MEETDDIKGIYSFAEKNQKLTYLHTEVENLQIWVLDFVLVWSLYLAYVLFGIVFMKSSSRNLCLILLSVVSVLLLSKQLAIKSIDSYLKNIYKWQYFTLLFGF